MSELFTAKKVLSSLLTDKKEDAETVLKSAEKTTETKDLEKIDGKLKSREDVSLTDVVERDNKKMINVLRRGFKLDEFSNLDETAKLAEKQEKASGGITSAIKALGTLIFGGPMAKDIAKLVSKIGDIGKLIERIPGIGRIARAAPGLLRGAGSLLGKLALPLQAGLSALDARRGYNDVEAAKKNFDSENWYGRGMNAAKSVIDGLTFGLIPEEKVTRGLRTFMGDVDKDGNPNKDKWTPEQKAQWEEWVKEHEEKSGKDRSTMPPPPPPAARTAQTVPGSKDQSLPQDVTSHIFQSQSGPGKYRAGSLPRDVEQEIEANARKYNMDADYMKGFAWLESQGKKDAKNGSYYGVYQLGADAAKDVGVDRNDWKQNIEGGFKYAQRNKRDLARRLNIPEADVTPEMLYLAHQQGSRGAAELIQAARDGKRVDELTPAQQKNIRGNVGGKSEYVSGFLNANVEKIRDYKDYYAARNPENAQDRVTQVASTGVKAKPQVIMNPTPDQVASAKADPSYRPAAPAVQAKPLPTREPLIPQPVVESKKPAAAPAPNPVTDGISSRAPGGGQQLGLDNMLNIPTDEKLNIMNSGIA